MNKEICLTNLQSAVSEQEKIYTSMNGKYACKVKAEILEERFFWVSCDYGETTIFYDKVINQGTKQTENNPRSRQQIEPNRQLFACYDCYRHKLYLNNRKQSNILLAYLRDSTNEEFEISHVYASVDEFCNRIKTLHEFRYTQVDNLFRSDGDLFSKVGDLYGRDLPSKIQLKISYMNIPVHDGGGKAIIDLLYRHKDEFKNVVIIGNDDNGIEHTFDFDSLIKNIQILPNEDDGGRFDSEEVKRLLLGAIR